MLFQRRSPPDWREKLRVAVWPRRSWSRSLKYLAKRVLRLTASPHAIAAGIAAGVFASFTPYMGLHFIISFIVAYVIAGNMIAAASGTFIGNPITFPFIWAATYSTGNFILKGEITDGGPQHTLEAFAKTDWWHLGPRGVANLAASIWEPVLKPMSVGAIPLGIGAGLIAYLITRWAAVAFQMSRRKMLAEKARKLKEKAMRLAESDDRINA
ncbi:MAG: DUF2062 domain-containing protein [Nitratireductor sp.]|nr:DUF2062 domain-containing protein [Nitratireductor sp.]